MFKSCVNFFRLTFPQFIFDIYLKKYLDNIFTPKLPVLSVPKLPIYIFLPYLGNHSHHCKKKLTSIINRFFPQVDFKCLFVNRNTIGSFSPFNDQIPHMVSSKIIYKYLCGQCNSSYVGETRRLFISRICEHKGISPRTNVPFANPPFSNIREHALNCNHPIKIDNFSVLARCIYATLF